MRAKGREGVDADGVIPHWRPLGKEMAGSESLTVESQRRAAGACIPTRCLPPQQTNPEGEGREEHPQRHSLLLFLAPRLRLLATPLSFSLFPSLREPQSSMCLNTSRT